MSISLAIFTFINLWWVMLFFVLPHVIERREEQVPGEYAASPKRIYWKKAFIVTTLLALTVTAMLAFAIHNEMVPLRGVTGGV